MPLPPNSSARGSAPLVSDIVMVSLPPRPNTWTSCTLATVAGAGSPTMPTAPPLTWMAPAALRLTVMVLSRLSANTDSRPFAPALKLAVTAAAAGWPVRTKFPTASAAVVNPAATSRGALRVRRLSIVVISFSLRRRPGWSRLVVATEW